MVALACLALLCFPVAAPAPVEAAGETAEIRLLVGESLVLRTKADVHRTAVATEDIVTLSQFTPRELALAGRRAGTATVTFWFRDPAQPPVIYAVQVVERPAP